MKEIKNEIDEEVNKEKDKPLKDDSRDGTAKDDDREEIIDKKVQPLQWSPFNDQLSLDSDDREDSPCSSDSEETASTGTVNEEGDTSVDSNSTDEISIGTIFELQVHEHHDPAERELSDDHEDIDEGDNDEVDNAEQHDQHKPRKGDRVKFFCSSSNTWLHVTLTSEGMKRYGGNYYNYKLDDGGLGGVDLVPGKSWTHTNIAQIVHDDPLNALAVEGNAIDQVNDADDDYNVLAAEGNAIDQEIEVAAEDEGTAPYEDNEIDPHNDAFANRVVDNPLQIPFPEVQNLNAILPLTSTPLLSTASSSRPRLSDVRPRGLLPMEIEDSPLQQPRSRIQAALTRRADQVRKILSRSSSDSSST